MAETVRNNDLRIVGPDHPPVSILRLAVADARCATALAKSFGVVWPTTPNTTFDGDFTVFWLGPSEWALQGLSFAEVERRAATALGSKVHHVSDVGDGRAVFRVMGGRSREFLAKGLSLDLHPRVFAPNACAQTVFAQIHLLIRRVGDGDRFDLMVDSSLTDYVSTWLELPGQNEP